MNCFETDDGERISYRVSGSGPPLVVLHEWASSHRLWEPVAKLLQDDFTVYRWDARGHGGNPVVGSEEPTLSRMAKDLSLLFDHLQVDRPIVVGSSMGALILWEYIRCYGCQRLSKICVVDQSPRLRTDDAWTLGIYGDWTPERNAAFVAALEADFPETVLRLIAHGHNRKAREIYETNDTETKRLRAYLATLDPRPLITAWNSLIDADYRAVLPTITVPTLLVYGSESNYYSAATAQYVERAIPGAMLLVYDGADHSPHICHPRRFADDLKRFADNPQGSSAERPGTAAVQGLALWPP